MSQGGVLSGFLLGLLITVCNQIIYMLIGAVADRCAWTNSDAKDCFYCVKYTFAVFFNTCIDLGTVLILAHGFSTESAMKMQISCDSTMSAQAIAESPNVQKALYVQLVSYIFPSCTLIPFLIEPFAVSFLPFAIGKALIRSRPEATAQDAEECLQNPPYDLSRYADILSIVMLCCMTMVFTDRDLWQIYFFLILSLVVIYAWDQMRVLRFTTKTIFTSARMDDIVMWMMAMPAGVIAMCLAFKVYSAAHEGFLDEFHQTLKGEVPFTVNHCNIFLYLGVAFLCHMLMHSMLLKFLVLPMADQTVPEKKIEGLYSVVGAERPGTYFNTNPVNCLRSKYIYKHDPPCVFFRIGKEHLIKKNEKIGIYYEAKEAIKPRHHRLRSEVFSFAEGI